MFLPDKCLNLIELVLSEETLYLRRALSVLCEYNYLGVLVLLVSSESLELFQQFVHFWVLALLAEQNLVHLEKDFVYLN